MAMLPTNLFARHRPLRIAVCGPGRHGKDTVSRWLAQNTTLRYRQSTSEAAAELVQRELAARGLHYNSPAECFADRHQHRQTWADIIWAYNQPDGMTLYRDMVERDGHDILNGIRRPGELQACCRAGLVDITLFVLRPDIAREQSCEITADDCDVVLWNGRTVETLHAKLQRLAGSWGCLREPIAT